MHPLRFQPVFRQYLWGGRRLGSVLGKSIGDGDDYAESWEVVDHQDGQSLVAYGEFSNQSLHTLVTDHGETLLGRHCPQPRFPLLFKFLDAQKTLSVQVHPDDARAALLNPPDLGKTEAWIILDAQPDSLIYAGLKNGVDRDTLLREINRQTAEHCLHTIQPQVGDCIFLPAGVVHAIGAGLVVAEIQQASNTTYRLYDWNRVNKDGQPRELHVQAGLEAIDYQAGPVHPQVPQETDDPACEQLVHCDKFVLRRWTSRPANTLTIRTTHEAHILAVLQGTVMLDGDPSGLPLTKGQTTLVPAAHQEISFTVLDDQPAIVLDAYLP